MSGLSVKFKKIIFLTVLTWLLALAMPLAGEAKEASPAVAPAFELPPMRGAANMSGVDLSGLETYLASDADFQLKAGQGQSGKTASEATVMDKALGVIGLPGTAHKSDDESDYDKAWRMTDGPGGLTRLTYGERYRRNPDGSYGAQSSSQWSGPSNIGQRLLEQALSAGSGYFSSWAEGWLGGYGQARIGVRVNDQGGVTGSGDFLYPIYDSDNSTFFTQIGLRTTSNDRVIGNLGLGQRFFPAENLALGYNVFIDQDFSRNHTRGGAGVEGWYDWLRLSANYYTPLSGWKDSKDYDSRLVEERPAEGYDARLTGYLPFYRNLAVTGAFEKWIGGHVGSFGTDEVVQKDPKVWSYGLEWTPVPAFSTSVNQRHSGGQKETQFGLTFNYHFGMDWEDQLTPSVVTDMRTVDGSRHDFVNRQNEMILEYRAKEGVYNIVLLRTLGAARNIFEFQITDGFGKAVSGLTVSVSADTGVVVLNPSTGLAAGQFSTDADGRITIELSTLAATTTQVTLTAGRTSQTFSINVSPLGNLTLTAGSGQLLVNSTTALTFTMTGPGAVNNQTVTWSTSDGALSSTTSATDSAGLCAVDLTGPATRGPVTVRAVLDDGRYVEAQLLFGTLRGTLRVEPQDVKKDIVPSNGSTTLRATIIAPQFNYGSGEVAYTGRLDGLTVDWDKSREYVYSQTGASATPPSGLSPTNLLVASLFSGATLTDASGVATVTFAPAISGGSAGGVQIQATLAIPHSAAGTVNLAVGFDTDWLDNSSPDGWFTAYQVAGGTGNTNVAGYQAATNLPTFEQLLGISVNYFRPASLAAPNAQFWTGAAIGMGPLSGVVGLDTSVAAWTNNLSMSPRILILQ